MRPRQYKMPISQTTIERLHKIISPEYERDVKELLSGRHAWKRTRDIIEVTSKVLGGLASVVAFGASAIKEPDASNWMSFGSGCIGTLSLTLMLFANYSGGISRLRTKELNSILKYIGVTPVANIVSNPDGDEVQENMETARSSFNASMLNTIQS